MKIPVQTPLEQIHNNLSLLRGKALHAIATFRTNILTNRDAHDTKPAQFKMSDTREIAIVPYESSAKAVDYDSFAYALESAMTESLPDDERLSLSGHVRNFFYHPARVVAALIIVILIGYIAIMAGQATSNNRQPIEQSKYQKQIKN
ncbi:hypothetical protein [Leuconostoc rapi]|uniref:hypothetical protein n=1 Tax=Leuconostoc rapi TaxID=1406906 RepID=UPI00195F1C68|nr:hypothetical protein [Leuconostoc rapi]MBM7435006.1 hypothetical protein [Leuconostoc rapi]